MYAQLLNIVLVMTLCYGAWGFFHMFLYRRGIDYTHRFVWTTTYFAVAGVLMTVLFWQTLAPFVMRPVLGVLVILAVFIVAQTVFTVLFPRYVREPVEYLRRHPNRYYLTIGWRRLIAKSADIAAQQVFIVLFLAFLRDAGLAGWQLLGAFFILFALLHVPLIVSERGRWPSWLFAGAVVVFSVTFPPLILTVDYGFVYTYMLHWLFYSATSVIFWLRAAGRK